MTITLSYDLHGVRIAGRVHSDGIAHALERRLVSFRTAPSRHPDVTLAYRVEPIARPTGRGRLVYQSPGVQARYFDDACVLYIDHPLGIRLRCHPVRGEIELSVDPGNAEAVGLATHSVLNAALIEVLKARGRYSLHAACAAVGGRGVVVVGPSGAGKSTLAIALARAGMDFLADDTVFLARRAGTVDVLGFPDEVDVTDKTISMYPELAAAASGLSKNGRQKRSLRLEEALPLTEALRCTPAAVVFARIADRDRSRLSAIDPIEGLVALAPNVLLTDPAASQSHLETLALLAHQTPCWRLEAGRDLAEVTERLVALAC